MSDGWKSGVDSCESDRCEFEKRHGVGLHKELAMKSLNGFDVLMNRRIERRVSKEGADERLCN